MRKAPDAFRTISEAADLLETPAHVLRFWESKFPQIKPVKRAGGRRYYRRIDIELLAGIRLLLHEQGMTIRGVQKLLAEKGPRHVAEMAPFADDVFDGDLVGDVVADDTADAPAPADTDAVAPSRPAPPEGPANAFGTLGDVPISTPRPDPAPVAQPPVPVQAAQLAHLLRTRQPRFKNTPRLLPLLARIEGLTARMTAQADRDRAR